MHYDFSGRHYLSFRENKCLSFEQRQKIKKMLKKNIEELKRKGIIKDISSREVTNVAFDWPVQYVGNLTLNSYYGGLGYVDENPDDGYFNDYYCDDHTYDGHEGTDIDSWPFGWYLYDNDMVEVIAAESGVIVGKYDGLEDNCTCDDFWNAIYIRHDDDSQAWYGHLKLNSLTNKAIGETVEKGEYLGIVGSSGCSSGPHLHFEVYDANDNLIDPYFDDCNDMNPTSWWANQRDHIEPSLNALFTHDSIPEFGCTIANEHPHFCDIFVPGQTVYTATYYRDQDAGDQDFLRIVDPNGNIWTSWDNTAVEYNSEAWDYWEWVLPEDGPFGIWKFEDDAYGITYTHEFQYMESFPMDLMDFKAIIKEDNSVQLTWITASEINNKGFEIQKSKEGKDWKVIGFIDGQGNSKGEINYVFSDKSPEKFNYYRLNQIDFDGNNKYSNVVFIKLKTDNKICVFPTPANNFLNISGINSNTNYYIYDKLGIVIRYGKTSGKINISNLVSGIYYIKTGKEAKVVKFVVK